jgi:hypothetical protein
MPAKPSPGRIRTEKWEKRMRRIGGSVLTVHAKGRRQRAEMKTMKTIEYEGRQYNGGGRLAWEGVAEMGSLLHLGDLILGFEKTDQNFSFTCLSIIHSIS